MNKTLVHTFSDHIEYRIPDTKSVRVSALLSKLHGFSADDGYKSPLIHKCLATKYIPITVNVYSDGSIEIKAKNER